MSATDALVVGEAVVDVVDGVEHPGGSAANAAVALARLGRPVRLLTAYADDDRGRLLEAHLRRAAVDLAADPRTLARTSTASAVLGPDGAATYSFDLAWDPPAPERPEAHWLHVCSLGAVLTPGADRVAEMLAATSATVSYDVNLRPAVTGTGPEVVAAVERVAAAADLVKASDEDLEALLPGLSLVEAAAHLLALGPRAVVVTRGGDGASWFGRGELAEVHVPAVPVRVVDTIGAGDTFGAALIDALWDLDLVEVTREQVEHALGHAVRAAAVTVSRPGADPPTRAELVG